MLNAINAVQSAINSAHFLHGTVLNLVGMSGEMEAVPINDEELMPSYRITPTYQVRA